MAQLSETPRDPMPMLGPNRDGVDTISLNQEIKFQAYTRVVLPIDGFVFWSPTVTLCAKGSLHYTQDIQQNEDETYGATTVNFTSQRKIAEFDQSPTKTIYIARLGEFRYSFSAVGVYEQSGLWHYQGHVIPPALETQLLDRPDSINPDEAIVSNSLPLWLALNTWSTPYNNGFTTGIDLYPSDLVPSNLVAPYGSVQIDEDTYGLQSAPYIDGNRDHYQLVVDHVQITLYGLQNNAAMDFVDAVNSYSILTGNFGIMNIPVMRDGKRIQPEIQAIAMQKKITFEVNYYQSRVADVARQLILSALPTFYIGQ